MPTFCITISNKHFRSSATPEAADLPTAVEEAVRGAVAIGVDELCKGEPLFGAEILIESEGAVVERRLVAVGSSPLSRSRRELADA
jgi:hypothetical protein